MRQPPNFFEFLTLPPPSLWVDGPHRGRGHVGRHCPYRNKIWCGSVHALLKYRSKTAKMQKFPIDSHSNDICDIYDFFAPYTNVLTYLLTYLLTNENFISPFFRPPGGANPQKGSTRTCKLWRESARGLSRNRWPNKKQNKKHTVKQIPRPSL